jgi:hypothetical protein
LKFHSYNTNNIKKIIKIIWKIKDEVKHKNFNILNIMKNSKLENHNIIKIIKFNYNWNLTVITLFYKENYKNIL